MVPVSPSRVPFDVRSFPETAGLQSCLVLHWCSQSFKVLIRLSTCASVTWFELDFVKQLIHELFVRHSTIPIVALLRIMKIPDCR